MKKISKFAFAFLAIYSFGAEEFFVGAAYGTQRATRQRAYKSREVTPDEIASALFPYLQSYESYAPKSPGRKAVVARALKDVGTAIHAIAWAGLDQSAGVDLNDQDSPGFKALLLTVILQSIWDKHHVRRWFDNHLSFGRPRRVFGLAAVPTVAPAQDRDVAPAVSLADPSWDTLLADPPSSGFGAPEHLFGIRFVPEQAC